MSGLAFSHGQEFPALVAACALTQLVPAVPIPFFTTIGAASLVVRFRALHYPSACVLWLSQRVKANPCPPRLLFPVGVLSILLVFSFFLLVFSFFCWCPFFPVDVFFFRLVSSFFCWWLLFSIGVSLQR